MVLYQAYEVFPNFLHLMEFYCYYYITVFITTEFYNTPKIPVSLYNTVHVSCPTSLTFSVGKITVQCSPFNLQLDIIPFSSYTFCVHGHLWDSCSNHSSTGVTRKLHIFKIRLKNFNLGTSKLSWIKQLKLFSLGFKLNVYALYITVYHEILY